MSDLHAGADNFVKKMHWRLKRNFRLVGEAMCEDLRALVDTQGPPRSTPGNPPHMDTQNLEATIDFVVDDDGLRILFPDYAIDLEFGTPTMAPRPFIEQVMAKYGANILDNMEIVE